MASPQVAAAETSQRAAPATDAPATSSADDGLSRRPRDARLIHLILSAQGIHSYQERVPLQLLDFAYRYTQSVLSDALRLAAEGYTATAGAPTSKRDTGNDSSITVNSLRQAIASRQDYQFHSALPKEFMLEQAAEKNRTMLPRIEKSWGVQLPPEKYCLTGIPWNLNEVWDSEDEDDVAEGEQQENGHAVNGANGTSRRGSGFGGMDGTDDRGEGEGEDEAMESFEDVFGPEKTDEDQEMTEGRT